MNMLASLRYLAALSEHRHYARAARSCGITQPALSNAPWLFIAADSLQGLRVTGLVLPEVFNLPGCG